MTLTGTPFLLLLVALMVLAPVATLLLWNRIAGPAVVRTVSRLGLLVACQVLAVSTLAASVNDYAYFYGSWSEVFSSAGLMVGGAPQFSTHTALMPANTLSPYGRLSAQPDRHFSSPAQYRSRGQLAKVQINGSISQLSTPAYVYLPPQYFQARYAHTSFPASLVITGYPSTHKMLVKRLQMHNVLLHQLQHHRAGPMVLVMMRPDVTFPRDTECTDVPGGPQVQTFMAQDIPTVIGHRYRVNARGWGAIGVSTGGYCATKIAMTYPSTFHAAVSISGYYFSLLDRSTGDLWGGSRVVRNLNSPTWRLAHLPAPPISLLITSSRGQLGLEGLSDMQRFVAHARPPLSITTLVERSGGHNFNTWKSELPMTLSWLYAHLPPPSSAVGARGANTARAETDGKTPVVRVQPSASVGIP
ncbi:MAG: esterase family protein [Actinomycetota bacterium]|nr:esterase family protein [Actinomycetota bacterium]